MSEYVVFNSTWSNEKFLFIIYYISNLIIKIKIITDTNKIF